jgi:quercetin 2,3-dioxygenase
LQLPDGHTTAFLVLSGEVLVDGEREAKEGDLAIFARSGDGITVNAKTKAKLLLMDGEPIDAPIVGQGPFVMNSTSELRQAFKDYQLGHMGELDS